MDIQSAEFVLSAAHLSDCPKQAIPEYAFIGRSNVGKSSLINMLTGRRQLAKTSVTPGKTQLINYFIINQHWFLVDLPGYGYAKASKAVKSGLEKLIRSYFEGRTQLTAAFVLIDVRHKPQPIDKMFMRWLGEHGMSFTIIFTKIDKLKPAAVAPQVQAYLDALTETDWETAPPHFQASSVSGAGKEEVLNFIAHTNQALQKQKKAP